MIEEKREKDEDEDDEDKRVREKAFLSGKFFACGGPCRCTMASHPRPCFKGMLEWMCDMTMGDPDDTPVNTQSNLRSDWRHWAKYCAAVSPNVNPWRPNIAKSSTPSG